MFQNNWNSIILIPFFSDIGPATVTRDHALLRQMLDNIQVYGGSDCPEMSIGAVKLALELSRPDSYIYVFTDASAKDHSLIDEVLPLVQEKLSKVTKITFLIFKSVISIISCSFFWEI